TFTGRAKAESSSVSSTRRVRAAASGTITEPLWDRGRALPGGGPRRRPRPALRSTDGRADRHLGLALRGLARQVLSERLAAATGAGLRGASVPEHRDQRQLLLAAAPRELRVLVGRRAGRLRVRGQRLALHHAHAAPRERGDGARELLRVRPLRARPEARPDSMAAAPDAALRARA